MGGEYVRQITLSGYYSISTAENELCRAGLDGKLICEQEILPGYVRLLSTLTYNLQLNSPPGKAFTIVDLSESMVAASLGASESR